MSRVLAMADVRAGIQRANDYIIAARMALADDDLDVHVRRALRAVLDQAIGEIDELDERIAEGEGR